MMPQWLELSPVYYLERQLAAERERQRGWYLTVCAVSADPAEPGPRARELVYGPPARREVGA